MNYGTPQIHTLERARDGVGPHFYFACEDCGWCSPLRATLAAAVHDHLEHEVEKQKLALPLGVRR